MANYSVPARRLFPAAVLALAVVGAPLLAVTTTPTAGVSTPLATCTPRPAFPCWCPTRPTTAASPRTPPTPTSLRSTVSRAPATTVEPASGWPRNSRTRGRSRCRGRPSAPAPSSSQTSHRWRLLSQLTATAGLRSAARRYPLSRPDFRAARGPSKGTHHGLRRQSQQQDRRLGRQGQRGDRQGDWRQEHRERGQSRSGEVEPQGCRREDQRRFQELAQAELPGPSPPR